MNKKGIATKKLIKEKACLLFAEKGFKQVTMKDICEITGLSRGGLYCHYKSTGQIFKEIVDDLMGFQEEEFKSNIDCGMSAAAILDLVLERYKNEMMDSSSSLSIAIYEYFSMKENTSKENALYEQYLLSAKMWERLIQYGIDCKEFNDVNITAVFELIIFSYQGVRMCSKLMPVGEEIPNRILNEIRKILVRGSYDDNRI